MALQPASCWLMITMITINASNNVKIVAELLEKMVHTDRVGLE